MTTAPTEGPKPVHDVEHETGTTAGLPPVGLPLSEVSRHFRRAVLIAAAVGLAGLVVTLLLGNIGIGMLFCVGLGLGSANGAAVQISAGRYAMRDEPDKRRFAMGVLARLAVVSLLALVLAVLFRPEGLAVLFGLAFFQLLMLAAASGAMVRTLRKEGPGA